ncbi:MAG: hypothetical protein AAGG75_06830 [Bacteroidota bacterium]
MEIKKFSIIKELLPAIVLLFLAFPALADCTFQQLKADELSVGVMLEWTTSDEYQNEAFLVERSSNGRRYETIGSVKGSGNSDIILKYNYLDSNAPPGTNWYRLKQIDYDGSTNYSQAIKVKKVVSDNFTISRKPNAYTAKDMFEININVRKGRKIEYLLTDWKGQPMQNGVLATRVGSNTLRLNLTGLRTAIYTIELRMGMEVEHLTIRKINDNYQLLNLGKVAPK